MSGRQDYEERRQARIDRLNAAAEKKSMQAEAAYKRSHDLVKDIPLGQPNIIGRSALPRLREKSRNAFEQSVRHDETAAYYAERAASAENNTAISSDDPTAIAKLREKVARLEAERDRVKASNKEARKNGTEQAPWYTLPYLGKDIKAAKDRIARLEQVGAMPAMLIEFEGGEVESDPETNRVMIRYDERQDNDIVEALKGRGFKWSPTAKAWQRLRNMNALRAACRVCGINWAEVKEEIKADAEAGEGGR